MILNYTLAAF